MIKFSRFALEHHVQAIFAQSVEHESSHLSSRRKFYRILHAEAARAQQSSEREATHQHDLKSIEVRVESLPSHRTVPPEQEACDSNVFARSICSFQISNVALVLRFFSAYDSKNTNSNGCVTVSYLTNILRTQHFIQFLLSVFDLNIRRINTLVESIVSRGLGGDMRRSSIMLFRSTLFFFSLTCIPKFIFIFSHTSLYTGIDDISVSSVSLKVYIMFVP